jgi:hypothetical protein
MTVAGLIEWLQTQDQNAVVHVVFHSPRYRYYLQGGTATIVAFDPDKHADYSDKELLLGVYEK